MKKDGYHPDPKAASTLHSSDAELENIVAKAELEEEERAAETKTEAKTESKTKGAKIDLPKGQARSKSTTQKDHTQKDCATGCGSKKPAILLCILAFILLITLIVGYIVRTRPTTAVLQATSNFFGAERLALVGNIHLELPYDEDFYNETYQKSFPAPAKDVVISFDYKHAAAAQSTTGYVKIITADDDEFEIKFNNATTIDGVIYLQTEGLNEAYQGTELPLILSATTNYFAGTVSMVDGTWWKFSIPDLLASSTKYTEEEKAAHAEAYKCVIDSVNLSADYTKEFAELYQDHQFLDSEHYSGKETKAKRSGALYRIKLDEEKFNNFVAGFNSTSLGKNLATCAAPINVKPANIISSLLRYVNLDEDAVVVLEIDPMSQQISRLFYTAGDEGSARSTIDIYVDYPATITMDEVPAESTDARPLVDQFNTDAANVVYTYFYIDYGAK